MPGCGAERHASHLQLEDQQRHQGIQPYTQHQHTTRMVLQVEACKYHITSHLQLEDQQRHQGLGHAAHREEPLAASEAVVRLKQPTKREGTRALRGREAWAGFRALRSACGSGTAAGLRCAAQRGASALAAIKRGNSPYTRSLSSSLAAVSSGALPPFFLARLGPARALGDASISGGSDSRMNVPCTAADNRCTA
jgi:hypothetical protein